jgi:hypothetical protein
MPSYGSVWKQVLHVILRDGRGEETVIDPDKNNALKPLAKEQLCGAG